MYPDGGIGGAALASASLRGSATIGFALAVFAFAVPASASAQATLEVDPVAPCYREQDTVRLPGSGFTQNGPVVFSRDNQPIGDPIIANPSGQVFAQLILPGLVAGQRRLTYVATDSTNPALTAQVSLLVTATDVGLQPDNGPPNRQLTIRARGFFGDSGTLYAHVVRAGKRPGKPRNMTIGQTRGACRTVSARKRLFRRGTPPGRYRVQFDTFRRFEARRSVETEFIVTVFRTAETAAVGSVSRASSR
jgi:hypothetical protein